MQWQPDFEDERPPLLLLRHLKRKYYLQKRQLIRALRRWTQPIYPTGVVSGGVADVARSWFWKTCYYASN